VEILLKSYFPTETDFHVPLPSSQEPKGKKRKLEQPNKEVVARPLREMRGHTSYLTFATLLPKYEECPPDLYHTLLKPKEGEKEKFEKGKDKPEGMEKEEQEEEEENDEVAQKDQEKIE